MKLSTLSAVALSASMVAAPLMASEVKPVQPTVATQSEAVVLGALTQAQLLALGVTGLAVGAAVLGGGSSSETSSPSTIQLQ